MNNTTEEKGKFATVMWGLAENFGGKISTDGLKMRFAALEGYTIDQITKSASWLLQNREKTFPAVPSTKEIIEAIESAQGGGPVVSIKTRAEIQADEVMAKVRYHGRDGVADFGDPITQRLMVTRWPYKQWASTLIEDEIKWWRKDFISAYEAYGDAEKKQLLPPGVNLKKLAGACVKRIE